METAVEILIKALQTYGVPVEKIRELIAPVRKQLDRPGEVLAQHVRRSLGLPGWDDAVCLRPYEIPKGSPAEGRSIAQLDLRSQAGALIVTVARDALGVTVPEATFRLQAGDTVQLLGTRDAVDRAMGRLAAAEGP